MTQMLKDSHQYAILELSLNKNSKFPIKFVNFIVKQGLNVNWSFFENSLQKNVSNQDNSTRKCVL